MNRLRILLLAPDVNPEAVSMPYVTYSHAAALAHLHDVSLVTGAPSVESAENFQIQLRHTSADSVWLSVFAGV